MNTATPRRACSRVREGEKGKSKIKLTNIGLFVGFDDFSQFKISCNDGHLKKRGRKRGERLSSTAPALAAADRAIWASNSCFSWGRGANNCSASAHPVGNPKVQIRSRHRRDSVWRRLVQREVASSSETTIPLSPAWC